MRSFLPLIFFICLNCRLPAADITATLDSSDGTSGFSFKDSASVEQARLDSDGNLTIKGNVGIGVSNPQATLEVSGDIHSRNPLVWEVVAHNIDTFTSSTIWADMADMSLNFTMPAQGKVLVEFSCSMFGNSTATARDYVQILVDGGTQISGMQYNPSAWELHSFYLSRIVTLAAGNHAAKVQYKVSTGTCYAPYVNSGIGDVGHRWLRVIPLN
ncbi:MAG: hypothetical protein PHQ23_03585 [Candidatus Wallbacteria bacterium]|nr:hypothetical protein [Candidatus Wallbacteria bacterium]